MCVSFAACLTECLCGSADGGQGTAEGRMARKYAKSRPREHNHFIEIHTRPFDQALTKGIQHGWGSPVAMAHVVWRSLCCPLIP